MALQWLVNKVSVSSFVNICTNCCSVVTGLSKKKPDATCSRKWWHLILICLARGQNLGTFTISKAPELSSKTLQWIWPFSTLIGTPFSLTSAIKHNCGITSHIAVDQAIYSASVEDRAISACSLEPQMMGHLANWASSYFAIVESHIESSLCTPLSSMWSIGPTIKCQSGRAKNYALILIAQRYLPMHFYSFMEACSSGCVDFSKKFSLPIILQ